MRQSSGGQLRNSGNEGLDTSILIRYLVQDDPIQSPRASKIIERLTEQVPGLVTVVVIVEIAWVLRSRYKGTPAEIGRRR